MAIKSISIKISCVLEKSDNKAIIKTCAFDKTGKILTTIQFADISNILRDLEIANEEFGIYDDFEDFENDLIKGALYKYLNKSLKSKKLNRLVKLYYKALHEASICEETCVFCNPSLKVVDFFPDFTFDISLSKEDVAQ